MKRITSILLCAIAIVFAQVNAFAENEIKDEPVLTESVGSSETISNYAILHINGPSLIEVNTMNVYGFDEYRSYLGSSYRYEWELVNVEDYVSTPYYMGYNAGLTCSFICHEPVTLSLRLNVYNMNDPDHPIGHAESYITVLPAGSL